MRNSTGPSTLSRTEQRDELLTGLGLLLHPIQQLILSDPPNLGEVPFIRAKFEQDMAAYLKMVKKFAAFNAVELTKEVTDVYLALSKFQDLFVSVQAGHMVLETRRDRFKLRLDDVVRAINRIPADDPGVIISANSPFQTYQRLRALCASAGTRVDLFDPYLSPDVFHRYISQCPTHVQVALVTDQSIMHPKTKRNEQLRDAIVSVSTLFALERPTTYRFLVTPSTHDRHLRVDNEILHIGGSIKDAAKGDPYTISKLDPIQSNHSFLDGIIATGIEWFGLTTAAHRIS